MSIQWFPGHMVAAQKKAAETMEFTDVVIEVLDARMPGASQNPMIKELGSARQRAHLKVLNKLITLTQYLKQKLLPFHAKNLVTQKKSWLLVNY